VLKHLKSHTYSILAAMYNSNNYKPRTGSIQAFDESPLHHSKRFPENERQIILTHKHKGQKNGVTLKFTAKG